MEGRYPIAETFRSPKGEGLYLGQPMTFIRFAGCSVGKIPFLKGNCTTWDGRKFDCDTDFSRHKWMTLEDIVNECAGFQYVCITGGEPLDHNLDPVVSKLQELGHKVHLETSGTKNPPGVEFNWVACSPKHHMLNIWWSIADEIKFLVDENFDEHRVVKLIKEHQPKGIIYIQPINYIRQINDDNTQRALALIQRHPEWRISIQAHKVLGVR